MAKKATNEQQRDSGGSTQPQLTVKELKTMLDDGLLDLRMREMSTVPVKAMSQIPQATNIDLSTNLLQVLPYDFATALVHITKLDLSRNSIVHLPDNFGELKNLLSLDLYKNQIEDLPLSFSKLNQLRWLDLKDNPLHPELAKAAGDCLDEKQCKKAAQQVVRYMSKLESDHERIRQQQLQRERELEALRRAEQESEMNAKKAKNAKKKSDKRKPESRKDDDDDEDETSIRQSQTNGSPTNKSSSGSDKKHLRGDAKRSRGYCCRFLLLLPLLITTLIIYALYNNCSAETKWIPKSTPLCRDLEAMIYTRTLPATLRNDFSTASQGLRTMIEKKASDTMTHIQHSNISTLANDALTSIGDGCVSAAETIRVSSMNAYRHTSIWWTNRGRPFLAEVFKVVSVWLVWFAEQSKLIARILVEIAIDIVDFTMEKSEHTYRWLAAHLSELPTTSVYYWEKAKLFWNNVK